MIERKTKISSRTRKIDGPDPGDAAAFGGTSVESRTPRSFATSAATVSTPVTRPGPYSPAASCGRIASRMRPEVASVRTP